MEISSAIVGEVTSPFNPTFFAIKITSPPYEGTALTFNNFGDAHN